MASESEQDRRETLADIVAEMRTRSREVKEAFGGRPDGVENMLDIWADRIEAAWRLERAEIATERAVLPAVCITHKPVGNAAAMREALVGIRALIADEPDGTPMIGAMKATIDAALSAPARNCDLYNAVEDSWQDYKQFRRQTGEDVYFDMMHFWPFAKWLLEPAEERKGERMEGNQMKMREALEAAHEFVYTACRQNIDIMVKDKNGERVVKSKDVLYKIYSALSAPARNCDVGTAEEQVVRFRDAMIHECFADGYCRCKDAAQCFARWAQTPYEAQEEGDE